MREREILHTESGNEKREEKEEKRSPHAPPINGGE
jgi:hypothetical protein